MGLAESLDRRIRAMGQSKPIQLGTIQTIEGNAVLVSGLVDQAMACDWSGAFAAEMLASGDAQLLVGRQVEVHFVDGQPIIAHTVIVGEK